MARPIELPTPVAVTGRGPFIVTADVKHTTPGQRGTIKLEQKRGDGAARVIESAVIISTEVDTVFASFQLVLEERGVVLLLATAHDEDGAHFHPDAAIIDVV